MNEYTAYESCKAFIEHLQRITNLSEATIQTQGDATSLVVDLREHLSGEERREAKTFNFTVTAQVYEGSLTVFVTLPHWEADMVSAWVHYKSYYDFGDKRVGLWMENNLKPQERHTPEQFERMKKLRHLFLLLGHYPIGIQGSGWEGMSNKPIFRKVAKALLEFNQDLLPCRIGAKHLRIEAGPHLIWMCPLDGQTPYIESYFHTKLRDTATLMREARILHELTQYVNRTVF
jgi:hypothetical protein